MKIRKICESLNIDRKTLVEACHQLNIEIIDDPRLPMFDDDVRSVVKHLFPEDFEAKLAVLYTPSAAALLYRQVAEIITQSIKTKWENANLELENFEKALANIELMAREEDDARCAKIRCAIVSDFITPKEMAKIQQEATSNYAKLRKFYKKEIEAYRVYLENKDSGQDVISLVKNVLK